MSLSTDDMVEILQLYARYNTAIDTGDGKAFGDCFVPDGYFDSSDRVSEGREAIAAYAVRPDKIPGMRHNATNIVIDGDGDHATGSAFLIGYSVSDGYKVICTGRYADELTRTAEGWRFSRRIFTIDR